MSSGEARRWLSGYRLNSFYSDLVATKLRDIDPMDAVREQFSWLSDDEVHNRFKAHFNRNLARFLLSEYVVILVHQKKESLLQTGNGLRLIAALDRHDISYKTLFSMGSSREVKTAMSPFVLESGCEEGTLEKMATALWRFMREHRKHEERKNKSAGVERWTASDLAMFLVSRMCSHIESLRSAAKHPSLQDVLPRPKSARNAKSNTENVNVPSVPGLAHTGSRGLLFKDADRFYAADVLLCSRYLSLFIDEYVHCEANSVRELMRRKAMGEPLIQHPFAREDVRRMPDMVLDMFAEWIDKIVPMLNDVVARKEKSGVWNRVKAIF